MNDQRKLICWSPHAAEGPQSSHSQEFLVASNSLRLFRATAVQQNANENQHASGPQLAPATAALVAGQTSTESGVTMYKPSTYDSSDVTPRTSFQLLDSISYPGQPFKCIGWSHARITPYMVAAGQISGKLVVMNFATTTGSGTHDPGASNANSDATSRIVKEFHPRYARACHVVCWNPVHTNQVATGLDRVRNGCGTLIWDVEQKGASVAVASTAAPMPGQPNSQFVGGGQGLSNSLLQVGAQTNILNTNRSAQPSPQAIETVTEPLGRVSNSEATLSLNWLPGDPYSLAVGTGFKWLRIYDIRGNSRPTSVVAHAKSVNGVSFDPFNAMRLATFSEEGTIKICLFNRTNRPLRDLRMLTRKELFSIHSTPVSATPIGSRAQPKTLLEVEWCPTAQHKLATVHREEDGFRLWDLSGSMPNFAPPPLNSVGGFSTGQGTGAADDSQPLESPAHTQDAALIGPSHDVAADSAPSRSIRIPCLSAGFGLGVAGVNGLGATGGSGGIAALGATGGNSGASQLQGGQGLPTLSSLSWHPSSKQRVLAITSHGLVEDMSIHDSIPCAWGAEGVAFGVNEKLFVAQGRSSGNKGSNGAITTTNSKDRSSALSLLQANPSDPTAILVADISTRMRAKGQAGFGLDVLGNYRLGQGVIQALKVSSGGSTTEMIVDAIQDEEALQRVWEWLLRCERSGANSSAVRDANGNRRGKFTGVLAYLLPQGIAKADAAVPKRSSVMVGNGPSGSPMNHSQTQQPAPGTLLSLLKNDAAASTASGSAGGFTGLSPPSLSLSTSPQNGFVPSGFQVYLSRARSEALASCCEGWFDLFSDSGDGSFLAGAPALARRRANVGVGSQNNQSVIQQQSSQQHQAYESYLTSLEARGLYEQAARVAVFHLDLERALQSLTLGARSSPADSGLGLVAMALSGYANFAAHASSGSLGPIGASTLWNQTWSSALGENGQGIMSPALVAIFRFLSAFQGNTTGGSIATPFQELLNSSDLPLSDRIGFSLRFLPDQALVEWLICATRDLLTKGDLDGLLLTGLNNLEVVEQVPPVQGTAPTQPPPTIQVHRSYTLDLLQSYLDRTADIQTAAVLGSFAGVAIPFGQVVGLNVNLHASSVDPSLILSQWLQHYKSLLNQWGLWSERAKFDVSRALLEKSWAEEEGAMRQAAAGKAGGPGSSNQALSKRPLHHTTVKAQISVRCNFCGQSLSLESMSGGGSGPAPGPGAGGHGGAGRTAAFRPRGRMASGRVPDQSSVRIRGCPHCKKSLPRCALCLVSFDCDTPHGGGPINPLTLKPRRKNPLVEGQEEDLIAGVSSLHVEDDTRFDSNTMHAFGKWFTWCQACRHGGHAEHMADWFSAHSECPVTDCHCRCMSLDLLSSTNGNQAGSNSMLKEVIPSPDRPKRQNSGQQKEQDEMQQANTQLAWQRAQFNAQQDPLAAQQSAALAQIQQAYPNGLPLDVLAVAQAIQLMNLARVGTPLNGPSNATSGSTLPAGQLMVRSASDILTGSAAQQSNLQSPSSSAPPMPMHLSQSPPYITDPPNSLPSPSSAQEVTRGHHHSASHSTIPRAGSSITLGTRQTAAPPPKGTFPLTRW